MAGTPTLQTALKTIDVLEAIARERVEAVTLAHVSELLGWSRAAAHQYLSSLVRAGWLEQDGERRYRLATGALLFARSVEEKAAIPSIIPTVMEELVEALREPISFAVLHGDEAVIVERREPPRALFHRNLERHLSMTTASGQVMLAFDGRVRERWRPEYDELARLAKERGYGEVRGNEWQGDAVEAIAVPILRGDWCLGALSVIAPVGRMDLDRALDELNRARARIEQALVEPEPSHG